MSYKRQVERVGAMRQKKMREIVEFAVKTEASFSKNGAQEQVTRQVQTCTTRSECSP